MTEDELIKDYERKTIDIGMALLKELNKKSIEYDIKGSDILTIVPSTLINVCLSALTSIATGFDDEKHRKAFILDFNKELLGCCLSHFDISFSDFVKRLPKLKKKVDLNNKEIKVKMDLNFH